ncbi:hypothetical protein B0H11DRAFT_1679512, partial [Mycena galericulata]
LSRLVLSARALQYDAGSTVSDTLERIEVDSAEELERAILSFVLEVQRMQHSSPNVTDPKLKRLYGVFSTANIGLGLVGAGAGGSRKGFGWVSLGDEDSRREVLSADIRKKDFTPPDNSCKCSNFVSFENDSFINCIRQVELVRRYTQNLITRMSSYLGLASNVHIARHVDIDGIRQSTGPGPNGMYAQTVDKARTLIRTLEFAMQSV